MRDESDYQVELERNNAQMEAMFNAMFPNINVPREDIYRILVYLDQTAVNAQVIPRVIRSVQNIIIGTGQGEVLIHVRGDTLTVEARERDGVISTKQVDTNV